MAKPRSSIAMLRAVLEIRNKRRHAAGEAAPADTPLEGPEKLVFDMIRKYFEQKIVEQENLSREEAKQRFQSLVDNYSTRQILQFFTEPMLIMGVPYIWFVVNSIVSMAAFLLLQNFAVLLAIAPAIHLLGYLHYHMNHKRMREEKINKILTEGIKI